MILAQKIIIGEMPRKILQAQSNTSIEIRTIKMCNTTGTKIKYCLFLDPGGKSECTKKTAIFMNKGLDRNETEVLHYEKDEFVISKKTELLCSCETSGALSITILGVFY